MKTWYFSEQSYQPAWDVETGSPKIDCPSLPVDPMVAQRIIKEALAEWRHCDRIGLNIMVNEHHASYTCMSVSCMITLGILAAQTKNVRLLALGIPLFNRMDPLRIAEEIAYVDVLSGGRLEVGLIKGSAFELYMSNANPAEGMARYWEAHEIIVRALSTTSGSFPWESRNFNYRNINVIPRCYQQPHPPMWLTTLSTSTAIEAARRGYVVGITGVARAARAAFPAYKKEFENVHGRPAPLDRLAYQGYVGIALDRKTGLERGRKILKFVEVSERVSERYINPPGYFPPETVAEFLRQGEVQSHRSRTLPDGTPMSYPPTPEEQILQNALFAGTPDDCFEQIRSFYESVGGFGHLVVQMGGDMTHEEILNSLTLYAEHVQPRLDALGITHELEMA